MSKQFTFAGFNWPRYVVELPKGRLADRLAAFKHGERKEASPYTHAPAPMTAGPHPGRGFYHNGTGMPGMRWQWCDEMKEARIDHTGWHTDPMGDGDTMRGIVFRLPHGRGFLYGWSFGEGMCGSLEGDIWPGDDERGAAYAADRCAERAAEKEREYQERWQAATELDDAIAEACDDARGLRLSWSNALHARLDAMRKGAKCAAGYLETVALCDLREKFREAADRLRDLRARLPEFADVER